MSMQRIAVSCLVMLIVVDVLFAAVLILAR
jgi:hypothetical protein